MQLSDDNGRGPWDSPNVRMIPSLNADSLLTHKCVRIILVPIYPHKSYLFHFKVRRNRSCAMYSYTVQSFIVVQIQETTSEFLEP